MFIHVVLFKLRDPARDSTEARARLLALREAIPFLRHLEVGIDVLRSARSYDLALYSKFDTRADHDAYQVHPAHEAVKEYLQTVRETSVVVDFED